MMGRILNIFLVAILLCASVSFAQARKGEEGVVVVRILPQAEVFGATYTLGEIAEMDGFDLNLLNHLSQIQIGTSPLPGRDVQVTETLVRSRLSGRIKNTHIKLSVPRGATVARASQVIPASQIQDLVLAKAAELTKLPASADLKQTINSAIPNVVLPKGSVVWTVEQQGSHLVTGGNRLFHVIASVNGEKAWDSMLRVSQKVFQKVLVARRPIRRNQIIRESDLTKIQKDLSSNRGDPYVTEKSKVVGKHAMRPIGRNEPLRLSMVQAPSDVSEGGRVFIVFNSGSLTLRVPGVALVQGKTGQFIPVRNLESGKIVHGILQPDETVKVN